MVNKYRYMMVAKNPNDWGTLEKTKVVNTPEMIMKLEKAKELRKIANRYASEARYLEIIVRQEQKLIAEKQVIGVDEE